MPDPARAHKSHDIDLRAVTWVAAALCGIVLAAAAGTYLAWRGASSAPRLLAPNTPAEIHVAGVALESAPHAGRAAYEAEKQRLLDTYEWVDADAGIARIPLHVAMRVLAQRAAARGKAAPPTARIAQ